MAKSSASFKPGQSGNPNGRPPLSKALTDALRSIAETKHGRSKRSHNQVLAETVWKLATTLSAKLPNGEVLRIDTFSDWFNLVRWISDRTEGRPPQAIDPEAEARFERLEALIDEQKQS